MIRIRKLLLTALVPLIAVPAVAQYRQGPSYADNGFRLRLGEFTPRGDSDYWFDKGFDFTGTEEDFEDLVAGLDFQRSLGRRLGLIVSASAYEGSLAQSYRDFEDPSGFDITHTTSLDITSFDVGLLYHLVRRNARVVPYVGAGGSVVGWRLIEDGEFIDFGTLEIFADRFEETGEALGWFYLLGLEVPLGESWRLFAESRWHRVDDKLAGDFEGLGTLDLSGRAVSFGAGWSF